MSKPLTTLSKSIANETTNLRQVPTYLTETKKEGNPRGVEEVISDLAKQNESRINDLWGGIGNAANYLYSLVSKNNQNTPKATKTFYEKLDEVIERKPKKSEFYIQKKDSYAVVPSPKIYDPRINTAEKSTVELMNLTNRTSGSFEIGTISYENLLQTGLEHLYFFLKTREVTGGVLNHLGQTQDQRLNFYEKSRKIKPTLEVAAKLNESSAVPIFYEGIFELFGNGKLTLAGKYFKKALAIDPDMTWANDFFALTSSNRKLAHQHLEIEMKKNPNPQSLQQIAQINFEEKKYDQALEKFEQVLTLDPKARLAHLRISEIYRHKNNPEKELEHLNKELENANYHKDQKLINRISRDLGYYNLRHDNPEEALRLFDYVGRHRLSHERQSTTHLFDRAYAVAMINDTETAEKGLLTVTREQFIKSGTQSRSTTAPVYLLPFKQLSEFRIECYGFDKSREKLEEQLQESEKISNPTARQSQLKLSLKTELATLLWIHANSINAKKPERTELFEEAKQLISEESENNPSYQAIKKALEEQLLSKRANVKTPKETPKETPGASPKSPSHHQVSQSNKSLNETLST